MHICKVSGLVLFDISNFWPSPDHVENIWREFAGVSSHDIAVVDIRNLKASLKATQRTQGSGGLYEIKVSIEGRRPNVLSERDDIRVLLERMRLNLRDVQRRDFRFPEAERRSKYNADEEDDRIQRTRCHYRR